MNGWRIGWWVSNLKGAGSRLPAPRRMLHHLRLGIVCAVMLWGACRLAVRLIPMPDGVITAGRGTSIVLTDRHGRLLREAWMDERGASRWASLDDISPWLKMATLTAEDRRFFDHHGVDGLAVARAAWQNVVAGEIRSGASTITSQVVACSGRRRGGWRVKMVEMAQAVRVEQELSKERILEIYLNIVPYGNNTRGAQSAALYYFGRPASELSLAQAALLAALPRGPSQYDPLRHLERARERQRWILDEMLRTGMVTAEAHGRAVAERMQVGSHAEAFLAPHFADLVQRRLQSTGVVRVRTTLDLELQSHVEAIVRRHLQAIEDRGAGSGAVVVLDNATGEVLAMVGSPDFFDAAGDGQVNGATALRQPGSTLKPFTYGLALERGGTTADLVQDTPVRYPTPTGEYAPRNYDGIFHGPVRMRTALACSYNVPAVRTLHDLGASACELLLARLHEAGLRSLDKPAAHYGLGLTLGDGEVTLLELTGAYRALARAGRYGPERMWTAAWDVEGQAVVTASAPESRVFSPQVAFLLTDILADRAARAPAFGLSSPLALPFACAVKTGTSQEYCDNWTVGFTTRYTVGVWVGNTRGQPMQGIPGVTGAAPIFREVMLHLHRNASPAPFTRPPGMRRMAVCPESGRPVGNDCPHSVLEWFEAGREPRGSCHERVASHFRATGTNSADAPGTAAREAVEHDACTQGNGTPTSRSGHGENLATVQSPQDGDVFVVDPALPSQYQTLSLAVDVPEGTPHVTWEVDGQVVARVRSPYVTDWRLVRGHHVVRALTPSCPPACATFDVR